MITTHHVEKITFDQDFMYLWVDGSQFKIALDTISPKLKAADDMQRNLYKVSASGYGIHWPLIDEDLAVDFLLKAS